MPTLSLLLLVLFALLATRVTAPLGQRLGLSDQPDMRKHHLGAIPLTGGIAIFLTIGFGTVLLGIAPLTLPMLGIACLVFALAVFDDAHHINPSLRLLLHYGSGILLATYGGIAIVDVGNLLAMGDIPLLLLSIPLTALSVAGLCNAYNMIDGIDGLAASTAALPLLVLYILAEQAHHPMANYLLLVLVPVVVFLLFNLGPNSMLLPKIFLGDGGSVTLGFLVTAALVFFSQAPNTLIEPVTALWLVTVPLMDMLATMLRRARHGRKLMEADRSHLHHTLMDMGLGTRQTLAVLVSYASLCALLGLALEAIPPYLSLLGYFLLFCGHCLFVIKADKIAGVLRQRQARRSVA
jgi:UDP-GlcNAc:undecaprenyl-phosphate GlcNAc-1-phosphate transferase